ncbi:MAG: flagellar basal-body rod protein FlgF [Desulfobacterales bacterium]|nr:flagellar basal-body rod protein FlgF [Deltaproteobacteria bacterium]NNL42295.1 flagellar basal-body rod protein FlgF [Desulfobacterales bacterium]
MSGAIYMSAAGAMAYEQRMQVISNNLANINTTGFKNETGHFQIIDSPDSIKEDLENKTISSEVVQPPLWLQYGTKTDFSAGALKHTGNPLDLALDGEGFFCIKTEQGTQYTRNGNFSLAQDGMLVTMDGLEVLGEGGSINIDGTAFAVDAKGNVSVDGNLVDTIKIVGFEQPDGLKKTGNSLFAIVDNNTVEIKAENTGVSQGFIELSNVNAISMITEMVEVLRGYESYQKAIKTADEANAKAINDIGRV